MAQDNTLYPVTKKSNPEFRGLATVTVIAKNPNLVLITSAAMAEPKIVEAKKILKVEKELEDNPGVPSEAVKPSDIRRRPVATQSS